MNQRHDIGLVLADVDNTLLTHERRLTAATIRAAQELHQAGIQLAVASSRPPRGMAMLVEPLALHGIIAGFNGGVLTRADLSVIETKLLDPAAAAGALAVILGLGLDAWIYTASDWLVRDPAAPHVAREIGAVQFAPVAVASFNPGHLAAAAKIVGVSDDPDLVEAAEAAVRKHLDGKVNATRSQPYYLDVTHPDANKGAVAIRLAEMLGIPLARIASIGDGANDVLMFRQTGVSIAMGNATAAVKSAAQVTTASNGDDGFAQAMHKYVLPWLG